MLLAKDCALPLEIRPGRCPMTPVGSPDRSKPFWVDSFTVRGSSYLKDHRVDGKTVYPAAGFSMAGIAVHKALTGAANQFQPVALEDLRFRHALTLSRGDLTLLRLSFKPDQNEFAVHDDQTDKSGLARKLATGRLTAINPARHVSGIDGDQLLKSCCEHVSVDDFYHRLGRSGLDYGPFFKGIRTARLSAPTGEAVTQLAGHHGLDTVGDPWARSITLLDSAFQSLAIVLDTDKDHLYMPSRIRGLRVYAALDQNLWCYTRLVKSTTRAVVGDITILNSDGRTLIEINGLLCMRVARGHVRSSTGSPGWRNSVPMHKNNLHQRPTPRFFRD